MKEISDRRYPIGKFEYGKSYSIDETRKHIKSIARLPKLLKKALKKLRDGALDKPYRSGGWTARQVIHHMADSHMNAYVRFKLAATEDTPIIKPYVEGSWAETEDAKHGSARSSLKILTALHDRWVGFIISLNEDDLDRGFYHPVNKRTLSLREAIALYAWHGKHHLAHIKIVVDGNFEKTEGNKDSASKTKEPQSKKVAEKTTPEKAAAPKKRVMSEAHKAKIRAAQQARRAAEKVAKPESAVAGVAKRGRKPLQPQIQKAQAQPTIKAGAASVKTRRPRRSSAEVAAEKAAKAAMPKLSRSEILANARAVAAAKRAAAGKSGSKNAPAAGKAKRGRPGKAAAAAAPKASATGKAKPGRPAKAAVAAAPKVSATGKAKPGRPAKAAAAAAPKASATGKAKPGRPAKAAVAAAPKVSATGKAKPGR
ncbi:MAG: YfiT family bacillithiol transferase, partial [Saprospiraceae bacterium]